MLPTLWLRNTWRWVGEHPPGQLTRTGDSIIELNHNTFGRRWLYCDHSGGRAPELLFTENETNRQRVFSVANDTPYVKDAFHRYLVHGEHAAVNPQATGTKAAAYYHLRVAAGKTATLQIRFTDHQSQTPFDSKFVQLFAQRQREADEFYQALTPELNDQNVRTIQRQALAALLWTKQYEERTTGKGDHQFLKTMFQGLERNFDWWQSCEDSQRQGLYAGGFLGLDDIAVFNRNLALPTGGHLQQSDGTAWAAMFALALWWKSRWNWPARIKPTCRRPCTTWKNSLKSPRP